MTVKHYSDLIAWQKAMDLTVDVYRQTDGFPPREIYGLTSQMRRAAVSVPSNIAEGQGRQSTKDFVHFLYVARIAPGVGNAGDSGGAVMFPRRCREIPPAPSHGRSVSYPQRPN